MNYNLNRFVFITFFVDLSVILTSSRKLTPFEYQRLDKIPTVNRIYGMEHFCRKLGIDNYLAYYSELKRTKVNSNWKTEFNEIKETVRDIDACSLRKTDPRVRSEDAVSEMGYKFCFNQCKLENKMYFKFLDSKLQKLIKAKSCKVNIRIIDNAIKKKSARKYYKCAKKGYKKYTCECVYQNYVVKIDEEFKEKFHEIYEDLRGRIASRDNLKILEDRYKIPMKLIAFLISYHLMPAEIFDFLLWWHCTDNNPYDKATPTSSTPVLSSEESKNIFETEEEDEEEEEEEQF